MGLYFGRSRSSYSSPPPETNNPDPTNYTIEKIESIGTYLILMVQYPDCKNFEGKKILIYKDTPPTFFIKQKSIDPHFSDNKKFHSPIARFIPTRNGWKMALLFVKMMSGNS